MNMKALVIGLGMGRQYWSWFYQMGYDITTVDADPNKQAKYLSVQDALVQMYDIVYIGTPNYTHEPIAHAVADHAHIVLVEKPGLADADSWQKLVDKFPKTRFVMVKNNQHRSEMPGFAKLAAMAEGGKIVWSRRDGIPQGAWFLNPKQAFGGVSRDLMPHLLSIYYNLNIIKESRSYKTLEDNSNVGIDTFCEIQYGTWRLIACWQNHSKDEFYIEFIINGKAIRFDIGDTFTAFGGCPGGPYMSMINTLQENANNNEYWLHENGVDLWIHQQLESL